MSKPKNKIELYRALSDAGHGHLANVLSTFGRPAARLRKAWEIIEAGGNVRFAQFSRDIIIIHRQGDPEGEVVNCWDF